MRILYTAYHYFLLLDDIVPETSFYVISTVYYWIFSVFTCMPLSPSDINWQQSEDGDSVWLGR